MDFPHPLGAQLSALTDALEDPGVDLQAVAAALAADVTAAVPSFLGFSMTVLLDGRPVTVTAIDADQTRAAGASLQVPLDPLAGAGPGSFVVFYAGRPGAFVDLAADTRYAYGLDGDVVLDGQLGVQTGAAEVLAEVNRYDEMTVLNQAIGVLLERGYLPEEGLDELLRRAVDHGCGLADAAEDLLTEIAG